jgi:hypothetical protein
MTKGELRKARQAEHAAREAERLAIGDMRTSQERHLDEYLAREARKRRKPRKLQTRQPTPGSAEWAETRGDDLGESPDY